MRSDIIDFTILIADWPTLSDRLVRRRGDDWQAKGGTEFYRWWSVNYVDLRPGTYTLTVPLVRGFWTPVVDNDRGTEAHYAAALRDPEYVGFTFGGGFAGHGVCAKSGTARFVVKSFSVG